MNNWVDSENGNNRDENVALHHRITTGLQAAEQKQTTGLIGKSQAGMKHHMVYRTVLSPFGPHFPCRHLCWTRGSLTKWSRKGAKMQGNPVDISLVLSSFMRDRKGCVTTAAQGRTPG